MRLLHVIARMDPVTGGVCQAVRTMIASLNELGAFNTVVCLDAPDASFLSDDPYPTFALGPGKGPWCYSSKLIPWLVNSFAHYDVVIVHGLWLYHTYAVRKSLHLFKAQCRKLNRSERLFPNFFIMPHGMLDPYFQQASGRKLKALRNWIYWKLIEGKVIDGMNGLLFTCEEERRLAPLPFHPYRPKKEMVVGLGVESPPPFTLVMREAFLQRCPFLLGNKYLLFLSRIHSKKGLDLLLKAYERCLLKALNANTAGSVSDPLPVNRAALNQITYPKLVIAGPGLNSLYGISLQRMITASPQLKDAVICTDMLTGDAKWGAFYGCDAFILPSHQENFGIAVVEAMACAKPVLISDKVNIWREIELAGAGIIRKDTAEGTQELIESWCNLPRDEQLKMGEQAISSYNRSFSPGPAAKHLLEAVI